MRHKLAVAVLVVNQENKILLIKNFVRGWEFPGGFVNFGESINSAAKREVFEESGIHIEVLKLLGLEQIVANSTCVIILKGKSISGKLTTSNESQEVGYFTFDEANKIMTHEWFRQRLIRCMDDKEIPYYIDH
ncbi:NUDIX hydrolase [Bacillus sp. CGMCC 1.16607]|uniref:NUDIX hydrolase n=1 Tax=Bacillus sp. CGMCC 1.16607 TaxID=3351842 RepID=UPI003644491A